MRVTGRPVGEESFVYGLWPMATLGYVLGVTFRGGWDFGGFDLGPGGVDDCGGVVGVFEWWVGALAELRETLKGTQ